MNLKDKCSNDNWSMCMPSKSFIHERLITKPLHESSSVWVTVEFSLPNHTFFIYPIDSVQLRIEAMKGFDSVYQSIISLAILHKCKLQDYPRFQIKIFLYVKPSRKLMQHNIIFCKALSLNLSRLFWMISIRSFFALWRPESIMFELSAWIQM